MAKNKPSVIMEFMVGLPGSGKTTFAKEFENKEKGKAKRIDFDTTFELSEWHRANEKDKGRIIRNTIENHIRYRCPYRLIMDGLFLTYEDIVRVIAATHCMFSHIEIGIHQWNEDRETCVKNDGGRRDVSSTNTILNAKFEQIYDSVKLLKMLEEKGCTNAEFAWVSPHKVKLKPDWERYFRGKAYVFEDGNIRSTKWCTGGAYGSCWGDGLSPVSPDEQPEFEELDELLMNICPAITFLQYKKIMRDCVWFEDSHESDYYGGGCDYRRYVCDTKKLYDTLSGFGFEME